MAIKLSKEVKKRAVTSIQKYFTENMEDEIGNLDAEFLLDFFVKEVGPGIYNQAITDAQAFVQDRLMDLELELFQSYPE